MELYHIIKLGLAFTFYAAYCVRPMFVYSLETDNEVDNNQESGLEFFQYFQGVDGRPGIDFPVYSYIPKTSFSCRGIDTGYYADLETGCQVFHICEDGRKISFLCPNGTVFQQAELICEWWNKVNCTSSPSLYEESAERLLNDIARRKASRRVETQNNQGSNYGAVMRMEERVRNGYNQRQRIKSNRIPDNYDIEQQIEQAESNNRHLANAQNSIQASPKQQRYQNHKYDSEDETSRQRSKQTKKDIDKETGNYLNTNYDQAPRRGGKKIEDSGKNAVNFGSKTAYDERQNKERFVIKVSEPVAATNPPPVKTTKYAYGSTVKDLFNSYDARPPQSSTNRGNVRFNNDQQNKNLPTTYSPVNKSSKLSKPRGIDDDNIELPPFPKHKSELTESVPVNAQQINFAQPEPKSTTHQSVINPNNLDSGETQVPQETASFAKNDFNAVSDGSLKTLSTSYPNHRTTYSEVKNLIHLQAPKKSSIQSITPHLVTTQPINNGKPFVGSRVGTTLLPNQPTTQSKYTYLPTTKSSISTIIFGVIRHPTTEVSPYGPPNVGNTERAFSETESSTPVTNALPTERFNVGNTDATFKPNVVPDITSTTIGPPNVKVPKQGSLNVGYDSNRLPVNEPPFVKKNIPLLYASNPSSTEKIIDHATVYGSFSSTTPRAATPYSPTVPTVTQSSQTYGHRFTTNPRTLNALNNAAPVRFDKGKDKISIHLSRNLGSQSRTSSSTPLGSQSSNLKVGAVFRVANEGVPESEAYGAVTKPFSFGVKSKIEKPRPFSKSLKFDNENQKGRNNEITTTFPSYHISSARPFTVSEPTSPTPYVNYQTTPKFNVYNNIDSMIGILQEIANYNAQKKKAEQGLAIPPSVSPQTLHSLAQYFANELQNNDTANSGLEDESKDRLTTLLTAMTVHGYNHLFRAPETKNGTESPETTTITVASKIGSEATSAPDLNTKTGDESATEETDLLATTSLPELRQLARNFSLALSSYLNDPETFRKSLESLRPTEPPPLEGADNIESSTTEDELLNFSDADIRPSSPAVPSPTWGYILATEGFKGNNQEEVKNSLNPDLHTADSQSFVPRFNSVQVNEKSRTGSTDLPPNHWTTSTRATKLWQKALSVNPAVVNDNLETTTSISVRNDEQTAEPELFNAEVLSDIVKPQSEITYDLRELPPVSLNSTQVHGILIDFMNHTKSDEHNRLNRILRKLNTSEQEFLDRMKEIESNPLTKRLILLLISECGANVTQDLGISASNHQQNYLNDVVKPAFGARVSKASDTRNVESRHAVENHSLRQLVHPDLTDDEQDTRALHLLNSLYAIASRFGKKR